MKALHKISLPPRYGQPNELDAQVFMADGNMKSLADIQIGDTVFSISDKLTLVKDTVVQVGETRSEFNYHLELRNGQEMLIEESLGVRTFDGWRNAQSLDPEDYIVIPKKLPNTHEDTISSVEAKLLALWFAEGKKQSPENFCFGYVDNAVLQECYEMAEEMSWALIPKINTESHYIFIPNRLPGKLKNSIEETFTQPLHWLQQYTSTDVGTGTFRIPRCIWQASNEILAVFINRFFACDGYINRSGKNRNIQIKLNNKNFLADLQLLLSRFKIKSVVGYYPFAFENKVIDQWRLTIGDMESVDIFINKIGILGKEAGLQEISAKIEQAKTSNSKTNVLPKQWRNHLKNTAWWFQKNHNLRISKNGGTHPDKVKRCAEIEKNESLLQMVNAPIRWMPIKAIRKLDSEPRTSYRLQTRKYNNYFVQGFLIHGLSK